MKRRTSQMIIGSAMSVAAIAVAIDHTRHSVPEPVARVQDDSSMEPSSGSESPCGLGASPCGFGGESPCGLGANVSPCSL